MDNVIDMEEYKRKRIYSQILNRGVCITPNKERLVAYNIPDVGDMYLLVIRLYPQDPEPYYSVTEVDAYRTPRVFLMDDREIFDKYKVKVS